MHFDNWGKRAFLPICLFQALHATNGGKKVHHIHPEAESTKSPKRCPISMMGYIFRGVGIIFTNFHIQNLRRCGVSHRLAFRSSLIGGRRGVSSAGVPFLSHRGGGVSSATRAATVLQECARHSLGSENLGKVAASDLSGESLTTLPTADRHVPCCHAQHICRHPYASQGEANPTARRRVFFMFFKKKEKAVNDFQGFKASNLTPRFGKART